MRVNKRKFRKSCEQIMHERVSANRDREVEELFNQFERNAIREKLSIDAAQREGWVPKESAA